MTLDFPYTLSDGNLDWLFAGLLPDKMPWLRSTVSTVRNMDVSAMVQARTPILTLPLIPTRRCILLQKTLHLCLPRQGQLGPADRAGSVFGCSGYVRTLESLAWETGMVVETCRTGHSLDNFGFEPGFDFDIDIHFDLASGSVVEPVEEPEHGPDGSGCIEFAIHSDSGCGH